ncbi:MAG: hypothetical protein JNK23_09105 [Opitutaceae bacterium]|nr:hypothetical protein [Opitutaceae bacterium]
MRFLANPIMLLALLLAAGAHARPFTVVAYNVENLFDLDGVAGYDDYQPARYSRAHALTKLRNIAKVGARFDDGRGPDVLMLCELETDATPGKTPPDYGALLAPYARVALEEMLGAKFDQRIADLPAEALLLKAFQEAGLTGYRVVTGDGVKPPPGERAPEIKNALFTRLPIVHTRKHPTTQARAILEVQVTVDGAPLFLFVNHWKSGASDPETEPLRVANATTLRRRLDEILRADPHADIILGGDFNAQYNQKQRYPRMATTGLNDVLRSQGDELAVRGPQHDLYNLWFELPPPERGSDTYRGEWGTLMHLIISRGLYDQRGVQYVDNSFAVAKFPGLNADARGLPARWTFDPPAGAGFSDHFPVVAKFTTVPDNRTDRWLELKNPSVDRPDLPPPPIVRSEPPRPAPLPAVDLDRIALDAKLLPAPAAIRDDAHKGKIFRIEGRVTASERLSVEVNGQTYEVWSYDAAMRASLRSRFNAGATMRFFGELAVFRERWQFVIRDASWVK